MTQTPAIPLPPPRARRRLREAASLTQAQLAARVGVSRETVRAWETGRTTPRGRKGEAYARLLDSLADPATEMTGHQQAEAEGPRPAEADVEAVARSAGSVDDGPSAGGRGAEPPALTPAQAFDALYAFCAPALVRQAYLLTGRRDLARESVERAFQRAWERWPEVARDRDPAGWVRAAAYEYALSPWHRFRLRHRHREPPAADPSARVLLAVMRKLPPPHRRTLLLYDGVGLNLPETAAETEATTPAAANRLMRAREAVAARLPELADPGELHRKLGEAASAERLRAAGAPAVRTGSERRARFWTRAAIAFTVALIGTTALALRTAPTRYEPPVPAGEAVRGLPPRVAPGALSDEELRLRAALREEWRSGPDRLVPLER
ncbi:helix-turn-helix domain-containing protein [Streptomyces sp. NPDC000134]|uniref:helix-turn-helix domain-containing protein n=1 Tax=Streptomyces sp. NPDC000134 TaxID=3364536 RepID=UPI00369C08D4